MRITPDTVALIVLGDAALVGGALGLGGVLGLRRSVAIVLIALGVACSALGILRIVATARRP
jgi:hypothetical protein